MFSGPSGQRVNNDVIAYGNHPGDWGFEPGRLGGVELECRQALTVSAHSSTVPVFELSVVGGK